MNLLETKTNYPNLQQLVIEETSWCKSLSTYIPHHSYKSVSSHLLKKCLEVSSLDTCKRKCTWTYRILLPVKVGNWRLLGVNSCTPVSDTNSYGHEVLKFYLVELVWKNSYTMHFHYQFCNNIIISSLCALLVLCFCMSQKHKINE